MHRETRRPPRAAVRQRLSKHGHIRVVTAHQFPVERLLKGPHRSGGCTRQPPRANGRDRRGLKTSRPHTTIVCAARSLAPMPHLTFFAGRGDAPTPGAIWCYEGNCWLSRDRTQSSRCSRSSRPCCPASSLADPYRSERPPTPSLSSSPPRLDPARYEDVDHDVAKIDRRHGAGCVPVCDDEGEAREPLDLVDARTCGRPFSAYSSTSARAAPGGKPGRQGQGGDTQDDPLD